MMVKLRRVEELDVPHWARSVVDNWRAILRIPPEFTDRNIYFVLTKVDNGADDAEIAETLVCAFTFGEF